MQYNSLDTRMVILKRTFTMSSYRKLTNYIDNLVLDQAMVDRDGYSLEFNALDEHEQGNLAALYLEYDDRDTTECFYEAQKITTDCEITCALLRLLENNTPDNQKEFATLVRENSIRKYRTRIQELINDACSDHTTILRRGCA